MREGERRSSPSSRQVTSSRRRFNIDGELHSEKTSVLWAVILGEQELLEIVSRRYYGNRADVFPRVRPDTVSAKPSHNARNLSRGTAQNDVLLLFPGVWYRNLCIEFEIERHRRSDEIQPPLRQVVRTRWL